jgi:hypothetical protein
MSSCKSIDDEDTPCSSLCHVIPVVIVESHHHVLEHIHHVLRKQKLTSINWSMVHFDAHPDLACPTNVPAAACFTPRSLPPDEEYEEDHDSCDDHVDDHVGEPANLATNGENKKNLYEMLDNTTSGIAEWILPLVLAGNLGKVEWIKPSFSNQLATGDYYYCVGVEDKLTEHSTDVVCFADLSRHARIKVTFCHPYYLDDYSVVPADNLVLKKDLHLRVSELPLNEIGMEVSEIIPSTSQPELWMLDICLDYFACVNPYIVDIEEVSPFAASAFVSLMAATKMNSVWGNLKGDDALQYQDDVTNFYKLLTQTISSGSLAIEYTGQLERYFEDANQAHLLIDRLVQTVATKHSSTLLQSAILEAIPNWSMPHNTESLVPQGIQDSLCLVEQAIKVRAMEHHSAPFLVTIARSTRDGFTPCDMVESLQTQILAMVHKFFGPEDDDSCVDSREYAVQSQHSRGCRLQIVRDYGQWEGSTLDDDG